MWPPQSLHVLRSPLPPWVLGEWASHRTTADREATSLLGTKRELHPPYHCSPRLLGFPYKPVQVTLLYSTFWAASNSFPGKYVCSGKTNPQEPEVRARFRRWEHHWASSLESNHQLTYQRHFLSLTQLSWMRTKVWSHLALICQSSMVPSM